MDHILSFVDSIPSLSFQQRRILTESAQDLELWHLPGRDSSLESLWPSDYDRSSRNEVRRIYNDVIAHIDALRHAEIDYSTLNVNYNFEGGKPDIDTDFPAPERIMGKCPCPRDGEQTRCCNLRTLDAVQQCAFACAYCSIQSFYSKGEIKVLKDLDQHLRTMALDEDVWHIGTGQSSDSLLLGDDYGTLTALCGFANVHPQVIIELKTKSARTDWLKLGLPRNMVTTWSLNADTPALREEHLTASPNARIMAAKKVSEAGHLVGFHIHPMFFFKGWQEEYKSLIMTLCDNIDPKNVVMIGIGTLTFTKQNLRALRQSGRPTRVTQMPLAPIAGKFSYDLGTKRMMFRHIYESFPRDWKENVFFYLCMEDPSLWESCLGRSYSCNADFEADMKRSYLSKVWPA